MKPNGLHDPSTTPRSSGSLAIPLDHLKERSPGMIVKQVSEPCVITVDARMTLTPPRRASIPYPAAGPSAAGLFFQTTEAAWSANDLERRSMRSDLAISAGVLLTWLAVMFVAETPSN